MSELNKGCTAARTSGLGQCTREEIESVPQPRFHIDTVRKVYSVSVLNINFDSTEVAIYHNRNFYWN